MEAGPSSLDVHPTDGVGGGGVGQDLLGEWVGGLFTLQAMVPAPTSTIRASNPAGHVLRAWVHLPKNDSNDNAEVFG